VIDQPKVADFIFERSHGNPLVNQPRSHGVTLAIGHTHARETPVETSRLNGEEILPAEMKRCVGRIGGVDYDFGRGMPVTTRRAFAGVGSVHVEVVVEPVLIVRAAGHDLDGLADRVRGQVEPGAIPRVAGIQNR